MRQDTRVLLDRLGEDKFKYYDFESPSFEIDIWPIFETLLLDERVVGKSALAMAPEPGLLEPAPVVVEQADSLPEKPLRLKPVVAPTREVAKLGMFAKYGAGIAAAGQGASVRDTLGRLALDRA